MSVVLAEAVERAVGRVLAEANGHLEALVDQELDRRLGQLVAERLADNVPTSGRSADSVPAPGHSAETSRRREPPNRGYEVPEPRGHAHEVVAERLTAKDQSLSADRDSKVCRVCSESKPTSAYERGRRTCRECRRRQERDRAARTATEADRPGADAQPD